jgi:NTP pyrophosphatase (non-canonical NTP hydrolase)
MAFGLVAEVGEIADKIAKWKRKKEAYVTDDHLVFNTWQTDEVDEKHVELMKELGDVLWFVAGIADHFGYSLSEVAEMNLEKLAGRKSKGAIVTHEDH